MGLSLKPMSMRLLPQIRKRGNLKTKMSNAKMVAKSEKEAVAVSINSERVKKSQEKTDAIMLRPQKADGKIIRDAAAKAGKTVSGYILDAVWEYMENHKEED